MLVSSEKTVCSSVRIGVSRDFSIEHLDDRWTLKRFDDPPLQKLFTLWRRRMVRTGQLLRNSQQEAWIKVEYLHTGVEREETLTKYEVLDAKRTTFTRKHRGTITGVLEAESHIPTPVVAIALRRTLAGWLSMPPKTGSWTVTKRRDIGLFGRD